MQNEDKLISVKKPKTWAAGRPTVTSSMKQIIATSGLVRGIKALLELNQTNDSDCPSCAWPDPDDHCATTEFCENEAKAVASEATSEIVDDRFFRTHSIDQLQAAKASKFHLKLSKFRSCSQSS